MVRSTGAPPPASQPRAARQPRELLLEAAELRQRGNFDRAEAICYPLVRRYPRYTAALHTLGLIYLDKGNFERALDCLVRASMLDPANWTTLTALSLFFGQEDLHLDAARPLRCRAQLMQRHGARSAAMSQF